MKLQRGTALPSLRAALILVVLATLPLARPARTSPPVTEEWVARYNNNNGTGSHTDSATALAVDGSGNVYVTGSSYSLNGAGSYDYATVKYDSAGNQVWAARYNGSGNNEDDATALAVDGSGNVYVTGSSSGNGTGFDYATVKYDSAGNQVWAARYDGPVNSFDDAYALTVDGSGNVCVTGRSTGNGTGWDYATVKYDSAGNQVWVARYNGPGNSTDEASALAVDGSGNVYVTGSSSGNGTGFDYATVKYDSSGSQVWAARYDGPLSGADDATALAVDGTGNVYSTGVSNGVGTGWDYATVKYDSGGNQVWVARYNGPASSNDAANALAVDGAGNVYVTGNSTGAATSNDYGTVKYDNGGNQVWAARYNGPANGNDQANALTVDDSGNVYVTGSSEGPGTFGDYATVKYDSSGDQVWEARYDGPVSSSESARSVAVDGSGNVYVTGSSYGGGATWNDYATIKYSQTQPDTTPPACVVGRVVTESPTRIYVPITVTDAGSGVAQVKLAPNSTNCRLEWTGPGGVVTAPIGTPIPISPAAASTTVRVVKVNSGQRSRVVVQVWDAVGNTAVCDPVIANLTVKNGRGLLVRVFNGIPQAERYITLQNGTPGLTRAALTVNGRIVSQGSLSDGQVVAVDVAQWLRPGKNTVRIAARGPQGATAVLTIGDVAPSAGATLSAAGVNLEFAP